MKRQLLLLLLFLFSIAGSSNASLVCDGDETEEILLAGSLYSKSTRSLIISPIEATISSTSLSVLFLNNLGVINVIIYSESGSTVYNQNIDTSSQSTITIDVSDWDSGSYQIYFANTAGRYMYGTFVL